MSKAIESACGMKAVHIRNLAGHIKRHNCASAVSQQDRRLIGGRARINIGQALARLDLSAEQISPKTIPRRNSGARALQAIPLQGHMRSRVRPILDLNE